jgi:serine/threonine protein kinase
MGYRLKELVGVGTFAEVWHAERVDEKGKRCAADVALKIGFYPLDDVRTERERAALYRTAPLQLPGTIRVLDLTTRNDRMVIALELAEDSLLGLSQRGLSKVQCVRYIGETAATLDDLHARQIVHGGINPTDILIRDGHAHIGDFGPLPCDAPTSRIPFYKALCMAPELQGGELLAESDQYALAATYAWLRLQDQVFPIPRQGELPEELDIGPLAEPEREILFTALNRRPDQRFSSCCAFAEALHHVL